MANVSEDFQQMIVDSKVPPKVNATRQSNKRRRLKASAAPSTTLIDASVISEDEQDRASRSGPCIALDLTAPDDDVLAGCKVLLGLSSQAWVA